MITSSAAAPGAPGRAAPRAAWKWDLLAWAGLALATLVMLWPLGLTNRVLAGLDALTYFEPYWAYRNAAMSSGHLPLWNPYLFLGVPFLANPQSAVLYPLHWPLTWLQADRALVWSALLHVWLAAGFTYTFARRSFGVTRLAGFLSGLLFGMGGFTLARLENINQLNALAWLPAMLWLYDEAARASGWRHRLRWGSGLIIVIALQLLAGHTQTAYVNLVGLGLYAVYTAIRWTLRHANGSVAPAPGKGSTFLENPDARCSPGRSPHRTASGGPAQHDNGRVSCLIRALWPLLAVLPAVLLAAAQIVPSLELNGLGLRTGGLPLRQAVSFSLRPRWLALSFLPPYRGGLAQAFASEGYAEFVAYVCITGLVLAGFAVVCMVRSRGASWKIRSRSGDTGPEDALPGALVLLALAGVFLALGAYNPLYYLFWRVIPGFDLFRAPVRWLELTALGLAVLAAMGLDAVGSQGWGGAGQDGVRGGAERRIPRNKARLALTLLLSAGLVVLLVFQQWPETGVFWMWLAVAALVAAGLLAGRRWPRAARVGLLAITVLELWVASRALPFTAATAPYVLSLRTAPAALLARVGDEPPAGRERFLSMSNIRYDPGDLAELRAMMADVLPADAIDRLVRGAKQTEIIAPNLSLRLQLPGIDGYDGGLLPTQDYGKLQTLFLPADQRLPDGRMGEQLHQIPSGQLLDLTGVRFVVTDKQNDLWTDDVYYDLEQPAVLEPGKSLEFDLASYPRFPATGLGIVSHVNGAAPEGSVAAEIEVQAEEGQSLTLPVRIGRDSAAGLGPSGGARVARPWPDWTGSKGQDYLARLEYGRPLVPKSITVRVPDGASAAFVLQGLSLIDERTGAHSSVTVSPRGDFRRIHSGDVKIYERTPAPGRAWLVHGLQAVADDDGALRLLAEPSFDPRQTVAVEGDYTALPPSAAADGEGVEVTEFSPEDIRLRAEVTHPAILVLADAFYPGWRATVDGAPARILKANLMFRAIELAPGSHEVSFRYEPSSLRWGVCVSLAALILLAGGIVATYLPARRFTPPKV